MKKLSNEIKVGVIALLTILAFIWLYSFLKGKDLFSSTTNYYVVYDKINGLAESSPVEINGYKVGVVQSIHIINDGTGRLFTKLSMDKNISIPKNSIAEITTATLIAGMKIQFIFGNGPGNYSQGDTIPGRLAESILTRLESQFSPITENIANMVIAFDSVLKAINDVMIPAFITNTQESVANLNNMTKNIDSIIATNKMELKSILTNISKFSKMMADNSENLSGAFNNLKSISDTLVAADPYKSFFKLKEDLEKTSILIENLNNGKGTAGQLITNDSVYKNLNMSLNSLNLLLQDLKANPKKYVHFSIFGRKGQSSK